MSSFKTALKEEKRFDLFEHTTLLGYSGSKSHGTYIPPAEKDGIDDDDMLGIAIPPLEYLYGLKKYEQTEIMFDEWDIVIYDVRKMFRLLLKGNPNVLGILWRDARDVVKKDKWGKMITDNRDIFTSKQAFHSFAGYANSQLSKMTRHEHKGFMGAKRKALVDKYGYDTKNAAHLIRLLSMCIEFMTEGRLYVNRGGRDASKLIDIKKGQWSLDKVKEESDHLFKLAREAYVHSELPDLPDLVAAEKLLFDIIDGVVEERKAATASQYTGRV